MDRTYSSSSVTTQNDVSMTSMPSQGDESSMKDLSDFTVSRSSLVDSISSVRSDVSLSSDSGKPRRPSTALSTMTAGMGSLLWMAPELVKQMKKSQASYSSSVDVFSFGMICYEALQESLPWALNKDCAKYSYLIMDKIEAGERPFLDPSVCAEAPQGFVDLMKVCWSQDPEERPPFDVILHTLRDIQTSWHSKRRLSSELSISNSTKHDNDDDDDEFKPAPPGNHIELSEVVSTTRGSQQDDEEKKSDDFDEHETFSV